LQKIVKNFDLGRNFEKFFSKTLWVSVDRTIKKV